MVQSTAEIIPFPAERMEQVGRARLERSLDRLRAVLAEQAVAITAWRGQLDQLRDGVDTLGQSLGDYHAQLAAAKNDTDALNTEARRLEAWADDALAR